MKIKQMLLYALILVGFLTNRAAIVQSTDVSALDYAIYSQDALVHKGRQCEIAVYMKNSQPVTLWQTNFILPDGFSIATDQWGDYLTNISGNRTNTKRHSLSSSAIGDNVYRLMCASTTNAKFLYNDGEVAVVTLDIADNIIDGEYPVVWEKIIIVEDNEIAHKVERVVSKIVVKSYKRGDVNGDDLVDVDDINSIIDVILGFVNASKYEGRCDVDGDKLVDVDDVNAIIDIVLGLSE